MPRLSDEDWRGRVREDLREPFNVQSVLGQDLERWAEHLLFFEKDVDRQLADARADLAEMKANGMAYEEYGFERQAQIARWRPGAVAFKERAAKRRREVLAVLRAQRRQSHQDTMHQRLAEARGLVRALLRGDEGARLSAERAIAEWDGVTE